MLLFTLATGGPMILAGALSGALIWRRHRVWGGALGAVAGWALGVGAFFAWSDGPTSRHLSYWPALAAGTGRALPGLALGAALGAWLGRRDRTAGATLGALGGGAASLAGWTMIAGAL
jgi:hypothetical protein